MKVIEIGKRILSKAQIALVEPFDPSTNANFKSEKAYKGRVVLIDRTIVLTEQTPLEFASLHELRYLKEDELAINRELSFKVETFEPNADFQPTKPYKTRVKWSDGAETEHSKLLIMAPTEVIAALLDERPEAPVPHYRPSRRPQRGRKGSRRIEAAQT